MHENIKKIIQDRFDLLPEAIQDLLMSDFYEQSLVEIAQNYKMNIEQSTNLEIETTKVLMGLSNLTDFERNILKSLPYLNRTEVIEVIKEVNSKIFLNIETLLVLMNTPVEERPRFLDLEEGTGVVSEAMRNALKLQKVDTTETKKNLNDKPLSGLANIVTTTLKDKVPDPYRVPPK